MARGRSKSTVSQIANDVPVITNGISALHEKLGPATPPTSFRHSRSKSLSGREPKRQAEPIAAGPHLTPLDENDKSGLWNQYLESFNYDLVLKPHDIDQINIQHLDHVLGFQNNLRLNQQELNRFIKETDGLIENVDDLFSKYKNITSQTLDFDRSANSLLQKQVQYEEKFDQIHQYLKHFKHLDSITKNLSRSGSHLLTQKRQLFVEEILVNLDTSLEFVEAHPNFKDSELYESRFRQCMTRALTLIQNYLNNELKSIHDSVERSLHDSKKNLDIDLLIYNEFNNYLKYNQTVFNELIQELIKRSVKHSEYNGLVSDVLSNYFRIRLKFLRLFIDKTSTIHELYKAHESASLVQLCQNQISYFRKIIEREQDLFIKFFFFQASSSDPSIKLSFAWDEFYSFLRNAIDPLYDGIRLLVLRESNIGALCELTTLLQKYYEFEDGDDINGSIVDNQSIFSVGGQSGGGNDSVKYGLLFQPILDDTQNRLIFRIQKYVDNELMRYKPKPSDLKIGHVRKQSQTKETRHPLDVDYEENLFPDTYLPLAKALTILSSIYELINSVVFDDMAHYIVHASIKLLKNDYLKLAVGYMGQVDGQLSYLKNLILLRNQVKNFDIHCTRNDYYIDFTSGLADIWQSLKSSDFTNGGVSGVFLTLAKKTVPKVINDMLDANLEIEMESNNAVTDFITNCSNDICQPIIHKTKATKDNCTAFKDNLIIKIPNLYAQAKIILEDPVVTRFLMENLSNLILVTYEHFLNSLQPDQQPTEDLEDLMEADALYGFINDIIQHLYDDDEDQPKPPKFNEDILGALDLEDEISARSRPASPVSMDLML
ncbi:uncharacterized protein LODBEIA_P14130 [Lodderomyces beijingensis]|uniref:Conserved oligomeric Golgi complex subunit 3 n=1 Tax=Lodderomyces beijingensis TaxID=1775926 RepID=A0ABP0ZH47_9ASCO